MEVPDFRITHISANSDTLVQEVRKIGQPPSNTYGRQTMYDNRAGRPVTSPVAFKIVPLSDQGPAALPLTIEAQIGRSLPKGEYFLKGAGTDKNFVILSTDFEAHIEDSGSIRVPTTSQIAQEPLLCMFQGSRLPWHVPFKSANVPANPSEIPSKAEGECGQAWTWQLYRRIGDSGEMMYGECTVSLEMYFFTGPPGFRLHDQIKPECHVLDLIRMLIPSSEEINNMSDMNFSNMKINLANRTQRALEHFHAENMCNANDPGDPVYLQQQPDQNTWIFRLASMLRRTTRFGSGYDFGALFHFAFQVFGKQHDILTGDEVDFFEMDVAASQVGLPTIQFGSRAGGGIHLQPNWGMMQGVSARINEEVPVQGRITTYTSYCFTSLDLGTAEGPQVQLYSLRPLDPEEPEEVVDLHISPDNPLDVEVGPFAEPETQVLHPLVDIMLPDEDQSTT